MLGGLFLDRLAGRLVVPTLLRLEPVLAFHDHGLDLESGELLFDRGLSAFELRPRVRIDEDDVVVVRDGESLVLQLAREVVRVAVEQTDPGEQPAGIPAADHDPQTPVLVSHVRNLNRAYSYGVDWEAVVERERARYDEVELPVLRGNAAYGTGLALLMLGQSAEAGEWLTRAASSWQASWADATPTSWGRPIGVIKALLLAGDEAGVVEAADWALTLGCVDAESPIGRYAATLALLVLGRWPEARHQAISIQEHEDFPPAVADALAFIAGQDPVAYTEAVEAVLESFATRDAYLEDVAVADTVLVLQRLAARRRIAAELGASPLLPA